ncbi:alanine racemase [Mesorhizobium sp. M0217]|uniref:alanine racemase n=1 Tax=unclassified Mesorhizobium TaxID=325217 RepID=UPI003339B3B0
MKLLDFNEATDLELDGSVRGVPPGVVISSGKLSVMNWSPHDGSMTLPVLTLDEEALLSNATNFLQFAENEKVLLAPHAKTPMMPGLAASLVTAGAWGATVANVQQLSALMAAGVKRVIYGSPPGGMTGCTHLAAALALFPDVDAYVFLDSVQTVRALHQALRKRGGAKTFGLIEVGFGRTGARDIGTAMAIRDAIIATNGAIKLAGVATYEAGAAAGSGVDNQIVFRQLFRLVADAHRSAREAVPLGEHLIITAGGSSYFDEVIDALRPVAETQGPTSLVLRSGAIFFSDDGMQQRALAAIAARSRYGSIGNAIRPVLSLWAEVVSRPEQGLAIAGFGRRDAPTDQGVPIVRRIYRDGVKITSADAQLPVVAKLNDQHAFISGPGVEGLLVGDILQLGISHPCTALQCWSVVYGTDDQYRIQSAFKTHFG